MNNTNKTAFIFPGQGAQFVGMAKDFYDSLDVSRRTIDQAAEQLDFDLKGVMFEENDLINKTEYTQAAILAAELAMLRAVQERGIGADITAGLSLGEYAALVLSGALKEGDAIRLVRRRGILMETAQPSGKGGMSAVIGLDAAVIEKICGEVSLQTGMVVVPANYNCPGQIVISGDKAAVDAAGEACTAAGARLVAPLTVSGPFHSPLLKSAGQGLEKELEGVSLCDPAMPYVSNVSAEKVTSSDGIKELLVRQVYSPVKWEQSIMTMLSEGVTSFVEIGPGKSLASFLKRISRELKVTNVSSVADLDKLLGG